MLPMQPFHCDPQALATVTAIIDGMGSIGAAIGPLLTGYIAEAGGFDGVFLMLYIAAIAAGALLIRLCVKEVRQHMGTKGAWTAVLCAMHGTGLWALLESGLRSLSGPRSVDTHSMLASCALVGRLVSRPPDGKFVALVCLCPLLLSMPALCLWPVRSYTPSMHETLPCSYKC